jgi:DNA-binding SARP family transcriptional activator
LRVELLGEFRVVVESRAVPAEAWRRSKAAALVKLLALAPAHRLHREQLMEALWPELAPAAAAANLRKAVHYARGAVDGEDGASVVVSVGELLSLPREGTWVDVDAFRTAAAQARRSGDPEVYGTALELYRDGLLPEDRYEEWTLAARDELHADCVALLEELVGLLEARGEVEGAIRVARRLAAAEPLRESGYLVLMRLQALAGRRSEALREYERLREVFAAELGVEPSVAAQELYEEVRAGQEDEPELNAELWERVGQLRVVAGDAGGAVKAFSLALESGAPVAAAGRLHRQTAQARLMQHDADGAEADLSAAEALAADPAELARIACLRANQAWERGDIDSAQSFAERARELAERAGGSDDVAAAHEALAIVSHFRGAWREGVRSEISRLGADGSLGVPIARVFDIHHCIGQYHLYGDGLFDGVEEYARRTLEQAEQAGAVRAQAFAWCLLGESLLLQARWEEAGGCLERSCDLHASLGTRSGALPWQRLAELAVCAGAPAEADAPLRRASAIATVSPMARHMWGRIYATAAFAQLERGEPEAAARSLRAASAAAARYGDCPTCSALLNPVAAQTSSALDDVGAAAAYAESAASVAGMFDSSAWRAMAESASASVAAAEGDGALARERFATAAGMYERAGQPYWRERSLALAAAT